VGFSCFRLGTVVGFVVGTSDGSRLGLFIGVDDSDDDGMVC